jgi:uncharacterized protein YaaN involved in tellurite resistance
MRFGARLNIYAALPIIAAFPSFFQPVSTMLVDMAGAALLGFAAWLAREGIKAEDAYSVRIMARRPMIPRKIMAALICGLAVGLLRHEHQLMRDIKSLDQLYEKTLQFYDALAIYIAAGEAKLAALDNNDIPAKEAEVAAAPEADQVIRAQELRDLRAARDDLERRVHDLKLTRQVTMQSLPSIRLVQENDKSLVTKINSTLVNTVPLWETQLAQAVTIQRSTEAAEAVRAANDLTNELLEKNASNLRTSNRMIREEMERGVFDIEAVKRANAELVATIEDSLAIADEGRMRRAKAEEDMIKMEAELRDTLAAAKAKSTSTAS